MECHVAITNGVFREMEITQKDVCDVKWEKVGWEVITKIAATWKNVDSITFYEKKEHKIAFMLWFQICTS